MRIIIKDDKGNEEILFDNSYCPAIFTIFIIIGIIISWWAFGIVYAVILFLFLLLFALDEKITIDKGIESVIVEKRILVTKWKKDKIFRYKRDQGY